MRFLSLLPAPMRGRLALCVIAVIAGTSARGQTGGAWSELEALPAKIRAQPRRSIALRPSAQAYSAASSLLKDMHFAVEFSRRQEENPESEHAYLGPDERDRTEAWIRDMESSRDDFAWLKSVSDRSAEDLEIVRRVHESQPWVVADNVFFMKEAAWNVLSFQTPSLCGLTIAAVGPEGSVPVAIVRSAMSVPEREFVLTHEGFHVSQKPLDEIRAGLLVALGGGDPRRAASGAAVDDFLRFIVEGRAQRSALAAAGRRGLAVSSSMAGYYADNVAVADAVAAATGDKALDDLLDKGDAASFVAALGPERTRRLIEATSARAERGGPLDDVLRRLKGTARDSGR